MSGDRGPEGLDYPVVYRLSAPMGLLVGVGAAALAGLGGCLLWPGFGGQPRSAVDVFILRTFSLVLIGFGLYLAAGLVRWATVLYPDRVEYRGVFRTRSLNRADIVGYRIRQTRNTGKTYRLMPREGGGRGLTISAFGRPDGTLMAWLADFPDLDAQARRAAETTLLADPAWGADAASRGAALARARKAAGFLYGLALALAAWGLFAPDPYTLCILVLGLALPAAVVFVAVSGGRWSLLDMPSDARPSVVGIVMFPAMILALRAVIDVHLLDWRPLLVGAAAIGLALSGWSASGPLRGPRPRSTAFSMGLIGLAWGWGALVQLNARLDVAPASTERVRVLDHFISHGRSTTYRLRLDAWSARPASDDVNVPEDLYERVRVGDTVCVTPHPGALRVGWFEVQACPSGGSAASL